ncbi:MAG: hypothetical protein ACXAC7_20345 [Candidatus Hodarchaeales archaeon]
MKTRIIMHHSSEGASIKEVVSRLSELGFTTSLGSYDYQYTWPNDVSVEEVLDLVDKVIEKLRGCHVWFHFSTTID